MIGNLLKRLFVFKEIAEKQIFRLAEGTEI